MKTQTLFSKAAKKISMTATERNQLRERVISHMEYHPLHMPEVTKSTRFITFLTRHAGALRGLHAVRFRMIASACTFLFLASVPFVAEQSLPGDTLYPVKVRFNEGIRSQFLFSPYEKMQWETRRIERRIAEARVLVKEGNLTAEREHALEETVRSHTIAFQTQLAVLREQDAGEASVAEITLESALDIQSAVLNTDIAAKASSTDPNEGDVSGIAAIVREARAGVASSTTTETTDTASYELLVARVEENTTRVHALSQNLVNELTDAEKAEVEERITRVDEAIVASKKAHHDGKDDTAIALFRTALATTEKLIAFMTSIDLRSRVSLDTLVPQESPEEVSKMELEKKLALLSGRHTLLVASATLLTEPEKIEAKAQLEVLATLIENSTNEMSLGNVQEGHRIAAEAEALATDLEGTQSDTEPSL